MADDAALKSQQTAKVIYLLFIGNIIVQFLGIIGVVVAYIHKEDAPDWLKSHYQFQIRTFWIGLLIAVLGGLLLFVGIGFFVLLFWVVWVVIRCVKGMKLIDQKQPHPDPTSWLFG